MFFFSLTDMSDGTGSGPGDINNGNRGLSMVHVSIPNQGLHVHPSNHSSAVRQSIQVVRVWRNRGFSLKSKSFYSFEFISKRLKVIEQR